MKAPFTYYGGKGRFQHIIQPLIPKYKIYCEPFAGAASTLFHLENYVNTNENLNDLNGELINFYKVVKTPELFYQVLILVQGTLHSQTDFQKALKIYLNPKRHSRVKRAWATWTVFMMSHSADPHRGTTFRFSKGIRGGMNKEALSIHSSKNNFRSLCKRLERCTFWEMDAIDFIKKFDSSYTFFFIDPPYPESDQGNFAKMGFKMPQFIKLIELLPAIQGKFFLTSGLYQELEEARARNSWRSRDIEFTAAGNFNNAGKNEKFAKKRTEAFTWNYQEPQGSLFRK